MRPTHKPAAAFLLAVAIAAVASRGDAPATAPAPVPPTTRPTTGPAVAAFELLSSGHIAVMATINGHGPYRFVLDTGAPTSLISERVAKSADVLPKKFRRPLFSPLGNLGPQKVKSIDVGGGHQDGQKADVWNHPTVDLIAQEEGPLEGIIGFPFFAKFRSLIDYRAKTITFSPSTYQPVDTVQKLQAAISGGRVVLDPAVTLGLRVAKNPTASTPGVTVTAVLAHGSAAAAGVRVGDCLLTLNGRWTDAVDDVYTAAANIDASATTVPLTITRDGRTVVLTAAARHGI